MFRLSVSHLSLLALALTGCGDNRQPKDQDPFAPTTLLDMNPDPRVVEVEIVATIGTFQYVAGSTTEVWAYRDGGRAGSRPTIPGPMLDVNQGDLVVVHFRNELSEPTTIHWHGIRVPNAADGSEHTQTPVAPGGTFDYVFTAIDSGTYWYHPHIRGDIQLEKGLYAPMIVRGGVDPPVHADRTFVLDDVKLEADGRLDDSVSTTDVMFGRQGNALLVNGVVGGTLHVRAGARERWRFVDAANSRFFKVSLPGHPFLVIAWDGGVIPEPYLTETLLISPGERYEVIVDLEGMPGDQLVLQTLHHSRSPDLPDPGTLDLLSITLDDPAETIGPLPTSWASISPIPTTTSTRVERFSFHDAPDMKMSINGEIYPAVTPLLANTGDVAIWSLEDDVGMDHPFHLHGMFFQVLDVNGVAVEHRGWKDTVIVPRYATVRFAVRYGEPGHWMYHCHILEHQERGMMGVLTLSPRPGGSS